MPRFTAFAALLPAVATLAAFADPLPPDYKNIGVPVPPSYFTATVTGTVEGTYVTSISGGEDTVRLLDITSGYQSPWLLDNKVSVIGQTVSFGPVTVGDQLVFQVRNGDLFNPNSSFVQNGVPLGSLLASDPAYSEDGYGHAYVRPYAGGVVNGVTLPAGSYVSMEDLPFQFSDLNYADENFIFTNLSSSSVNPSAVPEPSTFALLGTGLLGAAGAVRRRINRA